jgi:aldehyde:ferredoxin oxidoreductase
VTLSRGYLVDTKIMAEMYSQATGLPIEEDELLRVGRRIVTLEKAFNVREGATRQDDTLPWRFMHEPIKTGPRMGMTTSQEELDQMLDEYYGLHGWDRATSWPRKETLESLGLEKVAADLEKRGKIPKR